MPIQFDPGDDLPIVMPNSIAERGDYRYERRPRIKQNGRGEAVTAQYDKVTWKWRWMPQADYVWFIEDLLGGADSRRFVGETQIYDDKMDLTTAISHCVVHRPTYSRQSNGYAYDVQFEITHILVSL